MRPREKKRSIPGDLLKNLFSISENCLQMLLFACIKIKRNSESSSDFPLRSVDANDSTDKSYSCFMYSKYEHFCDSVWIIKFVFHLWKCSKSYPKLLIYQKSLRTQNIQASALRLTASEKEWIAFVLFG